ncbi:protein kinase [Nocardia sp. AG03]|uniref:serine/threonine-protein kinase n=1 Tax=Nocardia sp. AG03 TaxID=3025312 RepID=UPI00325BF2E7
MHDIGEVFAGFTIERMLGQGGMGTVYLARHPRLDRLTALKLLNRDLFADERIRARFEREADLAAGLDHPGIVTVFDRGTEGEQLWISMQYVDGVDAATVDPMTLPPERAVQIIEGVADALDYAHGRGVLHRDVKPANILLARSSGGQGERVFLTDFGIARLRADSTHLTQQGMFTATLAYASPEQMTGAELDHRSDQYSLACSLYWMFTGIAPFDSPDPNEIIRGTLYLPPPPLALRRTGLPPAMDAVLAAAMAKHPAARFDSCTAFATACRQALSTSTPPVLPRPAGPPAGFYPPGAPQYPAQSQPPIPPQAPIPPQGQPPVVPHVQSPVAPPGSVVPQGPVPPRGRPPVVPQAGPQGQVPPSGQAPGFPAAPISPAHQAQWANQAPQGARPPASQAPQHPPVPPPSASAPTAGAPESSGVVSPSVDAQSDGATAAGGDAQPSAASPSSAGMSPSVTREPGPGTADDGGTSSVTGAPTEDDDPTAKEASEAGGTPLTEKTNSRGEDVSSTAATDVVDMPDLVAQEAANASAPTEVAVLASTRAVDGESKKDPVVSGDSGDASPERNVTPTNGPRDGAAVAGPPVGAPSGPPPGVPEGPPTGGLPMLPPGRGPWVGPPRRQVKPRLSAVHRLGWLTLAMLVLALLALVIALVVVVLPDDEDEAAASSGGSMPSSSVADDQEFDAGALAPSRRTFPTLVPQGAVTEGPGYRGARCVAVRDVSELAWKEPALQWNPITAGWQCERADNAAGAVSYLVLEYASPALARSVVGALPGAARYEGDKDGVPFQLRRWVVADPASSRVQTAHQVLSFPDDEDRANYLVAVSRRGSSGRDGAPRPSAQDEVIAWWEDVPL